MTKHLIYIGYFIILSSASPVYADIGDNSPIEIIEVTVQKRIQSVQDIAMTLNAISATSLANAEIKQATDVTTLIPNVNATRSISGTSNYYIRGVGMDGFNLSSVAAVGLYIDDVAIFNPMLANFTLFDISRVEVLKGPQNTLYGKNTTGGAINFISNMSAVGDEKNGYGYITIGNNNQVNINGAIEIPLTSDLNFRVAGYSHQRDGIVTSAITENNTKYNDIDKSGAKIQFSYNYNEELLLSGSLYSGKQRQIAEVKTAMSPSDGQTVINLNSQDLLKNNSSLINPPNDIDALGGFLKLSSSYDNFTFNMISAFEKVESKRADDWGGQHLPSAVYQTTTYNTTDTSSYSLELQWQSPQVSNTHWIFGLLFNKEQGDILQTALIDPAGPGRPDDTIADAGIGPMFDRGAWVEHNNQTVSTYGQITYPLTKKLNFTTGYRFSVQDLNPTVNSAGMMMDLPGQEFPLGSLGWYSLGNNDFNRFSDFVGFAQIERFLVANRGFPASAEVDEQFSEWGGKVSLDYRFDKKIMVYSALSRGFKMGAVNSNPTTASYNSLLSKVVKPETLITTEFGFKSDLFDHTVRINGAVFRNKWQDYQFYLVYNPGNPANLFASLVNLPEAEAKGAELDITWNASSTFRVNLGIGWLDTEVVNGELNTKDIPEQIVDGFQNQVVNGNKLTNAPEKNYNISLLKSIEFDESELELSLHYNYIGEHIHQLAGNHSNSWIANFSEKSVGTLTLNSVFHFGKNREYQLSMWAKNITDEQYCSERAIAPGTSPESVRLCAQAEPQSFGLTAKVSF